MKPILKFGFFESKNGKVTTKDIFNENNALIGKYTGDIKEGKLSGIGKLTLSNGDYFEGIFAENQIKTGKSFKLKEDNYTNVIYDGIFNNFQIDGDGNREIDLKIEIGVWKNGKKDGKFKINRKKSYEFSPPTEEWITYMRDEIIGDVKYLYGNGTIYIGNVGKYGEREGFGICHYKSGKEKKYDGTYLSSIEYFGDNGFVYEGHWKKDYRNGRGTLKDENGVIIADGFWENGKLKDGYLETRDVYYINLKNNFKSYRCSYNPIENVEGQKYIGEIKNGKKQGKGITIYKNGVKYEGEYEDDYEIGKGRKTYSNGCIYDGQWDKGLFEGKGTFYSESLTIVAIGEWQKNKLKKGMCTGLRFLPKEKVKLLKIERFEDILEYTGEIKDFNIEGKGSAIFESGERYEGEWVKNQRSGKGINTYSNGNVYDGDWVENKPQGIGEMCYQIDEETYLPKSGSKYSGLLVNGRMHGKGSLTTSEGNTYKGIFSENNFFEGTLTDKEGTIIQRGFWMNENCITSQVEKYIQANDYASAIAEYKNYLENPILIEGFKETNFENEIRKEIEKLETMEKELKIKDIFNSFEAKPRSTDDFDDFE